MIWFIATYPETLDLTRIIEYKTGQNSMSIEAIDLFGIIINY